MEDNFNELKENWKSAKEGHQSTNQEQMLQTVLSNRDKSKKAHIGNSLVLIFVVLGLVAFFYYLAPMQEALSRVGIALMIGGLLLRIIIEFISYQKGNRVDYAAASEQSVEQARQFYTYRKRIHGPVTIGIIALYSVGFYALTPEFSKYFSSFWMWMMDGSYLVIGFTLFIMLRKGVLQEMRDLQRITTIHESMQES